ncbi:MAG: cell division protein ZapE [Candidatus Paracaedibacteraceae bacterium]|nr:cell division protein ZapE [Candidatus Paracaedibacteraceae bacterium]
MTIFLNAHQQHAQKQMQKALTNISQNLKIKTLLSPFAKKTKYHGIYLHGPVGRGKTMLMRIFFDQVKEQKQEYHFDTFFAKLHQTLKEKSIDTLAKEIRQKGKVIWIDELQIYDIATAMLLRRLVPALIKQKVFILLTGNVSPIDLYKGGLNEEQFRSFIPYFTSHFLCLSLDGDIDYRQHSKAAPDSASKDFHFLLNATHSTKTIEEKFYNAYPHETAISFTLLLKEREWTLKNTLKDAALIDFQELAIGNRAFDDYRVLVQTFNHLFITNVPIFNEKNRDACRRFMAFIDIVYAQNCHLYISSDVRITELYQDATNQLPFERTISRLTELLQLGGTDSCAIDDCAWS